jgi:transcriptional regulator with XRE-family HTH domain
MLANTAREARRKRGWSFVHLSKRSGVSRGVIEQIEEESPSYVPSEGNTALLAEALNVPLGSLLAERDRLVERLRHRSYGAAKESGGAST